MSGNLRLLITCISLIMVLVVLVGCVPGKGDGSSNPLAAVLSKLQSLIPAAKKSTPAASSGSGQTASAGTSTGQSSTGTVPKNILDQLHKTTSFSCTLHSIPTNITTQGDYQVGWRLNERPFYVPKRDKNGTFGKITWSGINFTYTPMPGAIDTLTGYVSYTNGVLTVSYDYVNTDITDNLLMSVRNIPLDTKVFMDPRNVNNPLLMSCQTGGPTVKPYVTLLSWKSHIEQPKAGTKDGGMETWDGVLIGVDWTKGGNLCVTFSP